MADIRCVGGTSAAILDREHRVNRQDGAAVFVLVGAAVAAIAVGCHSRSHIVEAGFWFENVTFELPIGRQGLAADVSHEERKRIQSIALAEVRSAFEGLRVVFSDRPGGFYRVRVVQEFRLRPGPPGPAGVWRPMGPLGGEGAVSFRHVAVLAMHFAPPNADRGTIIDGIGRGIGNTAVHEFTHQILFGENFRGSTDAQSYEYEWANRADQYYSVLHWDTAWPILVKKIGK